MILSRRWGIQLVVASLILLPSLTSSLALMTGAASGPSRGAGAATMGQSPPQARPESQPQKPSDQTQKPSDEVLRLRSRLVLVPVSVSDASGRPVRDLTTEDFAIEEEGRRQQITAFGEPGQTPVEIALAFDVSGSTHARFTFEQDAAVRFVNRVLKPVDSVSVFSIGLTPKLVKPRTTKVDEAITGIRSLTPSREPTAFFDSVVQAAVYVGKVADPGARRVLLVISDGEENYSKSYKLNDALREVQKNDCLFYSINPSGPAIRLNEISLKGQSLMESLSSQTGGKAFIPENDEDLEAVFRQIADELQAQYLFGYYSTDEQADGEFRRIVARVPKRPDLRVRARQGYYAPKS